MKIKKNYQSENFDKLNYDNVAKIEMALPLNKLKQKSGISSVDEILKPPFELFYKLIQQNIKKDMVVLELGAGTGRHTGELVLTGASVFILDISEESLKVAKMKFPEIGRTILANMNSIPLANNSVDAIVSCGSLSYADPVKTNSEINRVLKPGGILIVLDSLNHNPFYRFNRFIRFLTRMRSKDSINRIPNLPRINQLREYFLFSQLDYFGSYLWLTLQIKKITGNSFGVKINNWLEKKFPSGKNAFKFVLICKNHK
jgi:ubiquinone/menaquinone biosynthesis C-methylase UbiE